MWIVLSTDWSRRSPRNPKRVRKELSETRSSKLGLLKASSMSLKKRMMKRSLSPLPLHRSMLVK